MPLATDSRRVGLNRADKEAIGKLMGKLSLTETIVISQGRNGRDWVVVTSESTPTSKTMKEDAEKLLLFLWCQIPSATTSHLTKMLKMPREEQDKLVRDLIQKHKYWELTKW